MKKLWIFTLMILLMAGCRPDFINIKQAVKQTVFPGREGVPLSVRYTVKFELLKPVQIETVRFNNKNTSFEIQKFLLKNIETKKNYKADQTLPPGNYIFTTSTRKKEEQESDNDLLIFTVNLSENKSYDYKVKLLQGENIFMP